MRFLTLLAGAVAVHLASGTAASQAPKITREPIRGLHGTIQAAVQGINGSGSEDRFQKYRSRPQDAVADQIDLRYYQHNFDYLNMRFWHIGERDYDAVVRLSLPHPYLSIDAAASESRFHLYPGEGGSRRRTGAAGLRWHSPSEDCFFSAVFPSQRVSYGKDNRTPVHYRASDAAATLVHAARWGIVEAGLGRLRFDDRTTEQPDHLTRDAWISFDRSTQSLAGFTAQVVATRIRRSAVSPRQTPTTASTGGRWNMTAYTSPLRPLVVTARAAGMYEHRLATRTAYARRSSETSVAAAWRGIPKLNIQAGYARKAISRLSRTQNTLSRPKWDTFWTTARFNPTPRWTAILKVETRQLENEPPSELQDPRRLWHNHIDLTDIRLFGSPTDTTEFHASVTSDRRRNSHRSVGFETATANFGGWIQLAPRLGLTSDFYSESYATSGAELAPYHIRANTTQIGLDWTLARGTSVNLGFTSYRAGGSESLRQNVFCLAARRRLADNRRLGIEVRRDRFRNLLDPKRNYNASVLWVSLGQDF
ncbi:MAG: hypothetical protein ACUVTZ_06110 [Armatimonadota bacterium]